MAKLPLLSCLLIGVFIALGLAVGGCSSSSFDGLTQAKLAGQDDDMCQPASGAATGMAALNGAQSTFAQCMQDRSAARPMGFGEGGRFAPGANPASLADIGQ
jgi:hypothetical protein